MPRCLFPGRANSSWIQTNPSCVLWLSPCKTSGVHFPEGNGKTDSALDHTRVGESCSGGWQGLGRGCSRGNCCQKVLENSPVGWTQHQLPAAGARGRSWSCARARPCPQSSAQGMGTRPHPCPGGKGEGKRKKRWWEGERGGEMNCLKLLLLLITSFITSCLLPGPRFISQLAGPPCARAADPSNIPRNCRGSAGLRRHTG